MRHCLVVLTIALATIIASSALAQETATYELVGMTTTNVPATSGVLGFTEECQALFGLGARMCTSVEVMRTTVVPVPVPGFSAWVRPQIAGTSDLAFDASGVTSTARDLSCGGWSQATGNGLATNELGQFGLLACEASARVACCTEIPGPMMASLVPSALWPGRGLLAVLILSAAVGVMIRNRVSSPG